MREMLGPDDAVVRSLLSSESPDSLAQQLITEPSSPIRPCARRCGMAAQRGRRLERSDDRAGAPDRSGAARAVRKIYEDEVQAPVAAGQEKIAKARFAVLGTNIYPDATFTLRVSYGAVQGWEEKGQQVEPFTQAVAPV